MNLNWYLKRLKMMSVKEILDYRIPQFIRTKITMRWSSRIKSEIFETNRDYAGPQYDSDKLVDLFEQYPFHHRYELFNTSFDIMELRNWRQDILSGIISPLGYFGSIKRQAFETHGDVKIISEISRLHFLPFLAFKHIASPTSGFLGKLNEILTDWKAQNPFLQSINWTSGIEIGIRSINLIYTHHILNQFDVLQNDTDLALRELISTHYHFLRGNLSLYSSANNHLMAELAGLICISNYLKLPERDNPLQWEKMFYDQIEQQVLEDGVHMELCTHYHAEVLDHILIALSFLENTNKSIPEAVSNRIQSMFDFISHVTYEGCKCIFGDNDEGSLINPFFDTSFSLYHSQLATANYKFEETYSHTGTIDFRNYLIYGNEFRAIPIDIKPTDAIFPNSGYFFSYDHAHKMKLAFDVGSIGDHISAAHGHSDIFHFGLAVNGLEFLIDPGTYQYHTKYAFWRNYFRGISAHNTISINKKDHAKQNGRMSWIARPNVAIVDYDLNKNQAVCKATTNAFLGEGIIHSRTVYHSKFNQKILLNDELVNRADLEVEIAFHLHFHPEVEIEHKESQLILKRNGNRLIISNGFISEGEIHNGNSQIPLGWYAPKYGQLVPTNSFRFKIRSKDNLEIRTEIIYA